MFLSLFFKIFSLNKVFFCQVIYLYKYLFNNKEMLKTATIRSLWYLIYKKTEKNYY